MSFTEKTSEYTSLDNLQATFSDVLNETNNDANITHAEQTDLFIRMEANISGIFMCEACNKLACQRKRILVQEQGETECHISIFAVVWRAIYAS